MGFWNRIKDVIVSGPTTAVKNERSENAAERAKHAQPSTPDVPPVPTGSAPQPVPAPEDAAEPAAAPEPPAAPAEPEYRTYTVKSGDTLSEIAAGYGVDWHEMARLNNLDNPDLIFPGQVFKVPNS